MTRPARADVARWSSAVAAWCVFWMVVGIWTGYELWQLSDLAGAVAETGRALGDVGGALEGLSRAPLVGESTEELSTRVLASSAEVVTQAQGAQGSLRQLAVLLGLTVALLPSVPAVLLLVLGRRQARPGSGG